MAGIYMHIPFCRKACHYCDFHFSTSRDRQREMIDAICRELILQKEYLAQQPIHTLYFGGVTPSLLTADELSSLTSTVKLHYALQLGAEVTLEANPDDLSEHTVSVLRQGVDPRSIMDAWTVNDAVLETLNRSHAALQSVDANRESIEAGITTVTVDV